MRQHKGKIVLRLQVILVVMLTLFAGVPLNANAATSEVVKEQFKVSDGVSYKDVRLSKSKTNQAVRVMEINVDDPHTNVEVGFPSGLNSVDQTTAQALTYHRNEHMVLGAINGSFFYSFNRPMYLISKDNRLVRAGVISDGEGQYVNEPIAFGINKNGKGLIDHYQLNMNFIHNGKEHAITSSNKQRLEDNLILYTSDFYSDYTETNNFGTEVVVTVPTKPTYEFGSTVTGKVIDIREYGEETKTKIPDNGFVLSGNGIGYDALKGIKSGDSISLTIGIDSKWKDSSFMLASGPMLVKNGEVALSMAPDSWKASQDAPRTAVAIDESGEKVFFVTVDGRQDGYSQGMNMTEFANYLVSLGADRALNLDGGGSTTMAVRYPGATQIKLANAPSDGAERAVSTILMAVSTESISTTDVYYTDVDPEDSHYNGVQWLTKKGIQGYENGSFGSGNNLTRPHAAIMFTRALGLSVPSKNKVVDYFKDVNADDRYAGFIAAVGKAGVFKGSNGNFLPEKELTREQMASTLVNAFDLESDGKDVAISLKNVSATHKNSVQTLANLGITNQLDNFRPEEIVTRGQFATFLYLSVQANK